MLCQPISQSQLLVVFLGKSVETIVISPCDTETSIFQHRIISNALSRDSFNVCLPIDTPGTLDCKDKYFFLKERCVFYIFFSVCANNNQLNMTKFIKVGHFHTFSISDIKDVKMSFLIRTLDNHRSPESLPVSVPSSVW